MGHKNKKTLIRQVSEELDGQFRAGKGRKKHIDKQLPDGMAGRIYTDTTLATYKKHCCYFVRWAKVAHSCATLNECKKYVPEWMETRRGLSAWTQKTEASALAKLYRCRAEDLGISTPTRKRTAIKRSRGPKRNDAHASKTTSNGKTRIWRSKRSRIKQPWVGSVGPCGIRVRTMSFNFWNILETAPREDCFSPPPNYVPSFTLTETS